MRDKLIPISNNNHIGNASKVSGRGTIRVRAGRQSRDGADWLVFRVADTGIGMSDEQLGQLLQRFSQVSASRRLKQDGAGLGLALSRELCRLLGGGGPCTAGVCAVLVATSR